MNSNNLPQSFCYLSDICPEIKQDLKYATCNNFLGKIINGYKCGKAILTIDAATALKKVYQELVWL